MKRRVFTVLAALSLLLCAATAALWVRSFFAFDAIVFGGEEQEHGGVFISVSGELLVGMNVRSDSVGYHWEHGPAHETNLGGAVWGMITGDNDSTEHEWAGFLLGWGTENYSFVMFAAPAWFVVIFTALLPCTAITQRRRRRHRLLANLCIKCGYDLRATPERCPECGTVSALDTGSDDA